MRKKLFALVFSLCSVAVSMAQSIKGTVVDETNNPLPFANVLLQDQEESFISGTTTDNEGNFTLKTTPDATTIEISYIGYSKVQINTAQYNSDTIKMTPDRNLLGEVVIRDYIPKTKIQGVALVTKVENSILAESGSANDVLKKLPGVTQKEETFVVLGKGTPVIYINGRQVRDSNELEQLNSSDIKEIEVIQNPGAQYDASVRAVIRLRTIKKQGDGFGFDLRSSLYQSENTDLVESLNMNYRHNGLDIFGSLTYNKYAYYQKSPIIQTLQGRQLLLLEQNSEFTGSQDNLYANLGFNYQFNDNHFIGVRYSPSRLLNGYVDHSSYTSATIGGVLDDKSTTITDGYQEPNLKHQLNMYYNGTIGKLNIDFNTDLLNDYFNETDKYSELSELQTDRQFETKSHVTNKLYASKLTLTYPLFKGTLTGGAEYSFISRTDNYVNPEGYIKSSYTRIDEDNINAFAEYIYPLPFGSVTAGLRYENMAFNYYQNDILQNDQSKKYNNFFPNVSINASAGNMQFMLSYASSTQRPSYHQLRNAVIYIDKYSLESGNPYLQPETMHDLTLASVWKFMQLAVSYQVIENAMIQSGYIVDGTDNQLLIRTTNLNQSIPVFNAIITATPTISFWSPSISAAFIKQWLTIDFPTKNIQFNKPIFQAEVGNTFVFGKGLMFSADYTFTGRGFDRVYQITEPMHRLDISLRKTFLKDALSVELRGDDLFQAKDVVKMVTDIYTIDQSSIRDSRRFSFTLRYKFNSANSKYKGTGAGNLQKSRL